jgi:GTP-binding protein
MVFLQVLIHKSMSDVDTCATSTPNFVDLVELTVISGNGGNGKISFHREKFVPKGGPDGGDGGDGGDIFLKATQRISTFLDISSKRVIKAGHGDDGSRRRQHGKRGKNSIVDVPCGTIVSSNGHILGDLTHDGDTVMVAKGGKGGKGNPHFSSSSNQTPRKATSGKPGITCQLRLELKIIANIGFVGYPNAGKSTLLKTLTQSNPKIGNYPFTTLHPNLGVLKHNNHELVIADMPGILERASEGIGLGNQFLRHISRTAVLVFVIEPTLPDVSDILSTLSTLKNELNTYDPTLLSEKKNLVVVSKTDVLSPSDLSTLQTILGDTSFIPLSCYWNNGIDALKDTLIKMVYDTNRS